MIAQDKSNKGATNALSQAAFRSESFAGELSDMARPLGIVAGTVTLPGNSPTPVSCELRKGPVEGLIDLIADAPTALAKRVTEVGTALAGLLRHHGVKLTGVGFALAPAAAAPAALMLDVPAGMTYDEHRQTYIDHSAPYQGNALWLEFTRPDGTTTTASAVRVNEWYGLTSAHLFELNGEHFTNQRVGNGSNFMSDPGTIRSVASFGIYPGWNSTWNAADLAWIKFDQPLPGGRDLTIGSIDVGDVVTTSGYGTPATPGMGILPIDGAREAYDAAVYRFGSAGISSIYAELRFNGFEPTSVVEGSSTPGNSGSGGFDPLTGDLLTINAGNIGGTNLLAYSLQLNLGLEPYRNWAVQNTTVPEPSVLVGGSGFLLLARRRGRRAVRAVE